MTRATRRNQLEAPLIRYLRGLGAVVIWPFSHINDARLLHDAIDNYPLTAEATVAVETARPCPALERLNYGAFPGVTSYARRPGYDAAFWVQPFTIVAVLREDRGVSNTFTNPRILSRNTNITQEIFWYHQSTDEIRMRIQAVAAAQVSAMYCNDNLWHVLTCLVETIGGPATQITGWKDDTALGNANGAGVLVDTARWLVLGAETNIAGVPTFQHHWPGSLSVVAFIPSFAWTLANQTAVYNLLGGTTPGVKAGFTGLAPYPLVKSDTFRAVNGTSINNFQLLYSRTGFGANTWVIQAGNADIQNNFARILAANSIATNDTDLPNCQLRCWVYLQANSAVGVVARFADANNYWYINIDDAANTFSITRVQAGVPNVDASVGVAIAAGIWYCIRVTLNGNDITATLDGANTITTTNAFNATADLHGWCGNTLWDWVDNWVCEFLA